MTVPEVIEILAAEAPGCRYLLEQAFAVDGIRVLVWLDDLGLSGDEIKDLFVDSGSDLGLFLLEIQFRATRPRTVREE